MNLGLTDKISSYYNYTGTGKKQSAKVQKQIFKAKWKRGFYK